MRGISIPILVIITMIIVLTILPEIIGRVLRARDIELNTGGVEVKSWTNMVIPQLLENTTTEKKVSTPLIIFSETKDNELLGYELALGLKTYLNMIKDPICCRCNATEGDWRICETTSCSQTKRVIDVINPDGAVFEETSYVITVTAPDDFKWLCIEVKQGGNT